MNILYLHGFGSTFDETSNKVSHLKKIGNVFGLNIDYSKGQEYVFDLLDEFLKNHHIDLLVGTSMGGWLANQIGSRCGIPFVSINPVISPSESLKKYLGNFLDFVGNFVSVRLEKIKKYDDFLLEGRGLILLDMGDGVIDPKETQERLSNQFEVVSYPGGSHRFDHMEQSLDLIQKFQNKGLDTSSPN